VNRRVLSALSIILVSTAAWAIEPSTLDTNANKAALKEIDQEIESLEREASLEHRIWELEVVKARLEGENAILKEQFQTIITILEKCHRR